MPQVLILEDLYPAVGCLAGLVKYVTNLPYTCSKA